MKNEKYLKKFQKKKPFPSNVPKNNNEHLITRNERPTQTLLLLYTTNRNVKIPSNWVLFTLIFDKFPEVNT